MNDEKWWQRFPGSGAAAWVSDWLDKRWEQIEEGHIVDARDALRGQRWRRGFDLTGMPMDTRERIARLVDVAADALREPVDTAAALDALEIAKRVLTQDLLEGKEGL